MALMTDSHGSHASHVDSHGSHGSLPRMLHRFQWRNLSYSTFASLSVNVSATFASKGEGGFYNARSHAPLD